MKYNYNKLKGTIREKCGTQQNYAQQLGISTTTLAQRLSNSTYFTQKEIETTKKIFNLTNNELVEIFFTHQ